MTEIKEDGTIFGYDPQDYAELTFDAKRSSNMSILFLSKRRGFAGTIGHILAELSLSFFLSAACLTLILFIYTLLIVGRVDLPLRSILTRAFPLTAGRAFATISLTIALATFAIFADIQFERSHSSVMSPLQFERGTYSLGETSIGESKTISLTLRNTGSSELTTDKVFGDCGCMTVQQSDQVAKGNSSIEILVRLTNPKLGLNSHRVVASSGETIAACNVQFLGIHAVRIRPRKVFVGVLDNTVSTTGCADFHIQNYAGPRLNDVSAHVLSERPPIRVTCAPDSFLTDGANIQLFVELEPGRSERGLLCEEIVLRAGKGQERVELPCTICIEARQRLPLQVVDGV